MQCVRALFGASDLLPVDERFHNLLALAGFVQGGVFLRKEPLERIGFKDRQL